MAVNFSKISKKMDSDTLTLIMVWAIGVVAFFVLWAILLKVIKRISERKQKDNTARDDAEPTETITEQPN